MFLGLTTKFSNSQHFIAEDDPDVITITETFLMDVKWKTKNFVRVITFATGKTESWVITQLGLIRIQLVVEWLFSWKVPWTGLEPWTCNEKICGCRNYLGKDIEKIHWLSVVAIDQRWQKNSWCKKFASQSSRRLTRKTSC